MGGGYESGVLFHYQVKRCFAAFRFNSTGRLHRDSLLALPQDRRSSRLYLPLPVATEGGFVKASPATAPGFRDRKQRYEDKMAAGGFVKITLRVPKDAKPDFEVMATVCRSNANLRPAMLRDVATGRYQKL